ncbi:MAG: AI-2E family transporter [Planctomycetia bacterium]|nr:MAG: AI-2E family transporter [Planctomycetia bacterium]
MSATVPPPSPAPTPPPAPGIPTAPQRPFTSVAILTTVAIGAVVTYLGPVLAPFLLALLLYFMIRPAAEALILRGIRPWLAYLALFLISTIALLAIGRVVQQNAVAFRDRIPLYRANLERLLVQVIGPDAVRSEPRVAAVTPRAAPAPTGMSAWRDTGLPVPERGTGAALDGRNPAMLSPDRPVEGLTGTALGPFYGPMPPPGTQPTSVPVDEPPSVKEYVSTGILDLYDISVRDVLNFAWSPAVSFLETLLLVFFYLLFILISAARLPGRVRRAFDGERSETLLTIGRGIAASISQYVKVKTAVSFGMAAVAGLIMWAFGVHYWQLWAFLFFALNYITYIGSLFACVPPIAIAFLQFENPLQAVLPAILIGANRLIWVDFVEIRFSGEHLNVDPVLVLLGIVYWGWFWGVLGMVLAVPMLVGLKIILGSFEKSRKYAILMSEV